MSLFFRPNIEKFEALKDMKGLIKCLKSKYSQDREIAARALGRIKDSSALESLAAALNDRNDDVRHAVVRALPMLKDNRAVNHLIAALDDKGFRIQLAAIHGLEKLKDYRAIEPLIFVLSLDNIFLSGDARRALQGITGEDFGKNVTKWEEWWNQNKERLLKE